MAARKKGKPFAIVESPRKASAILGYNAKDTGKIVEKTIKRHAREKKSPANDIQ